MKKRFIETDKIPESLWCRKTECLILPERLNRLWVNLLEKNDLLEMANKPAPKGFEGGVSKEDTDKHLAWRYNGSCARVILSILDPKKELFDISDTYASIFAGGKIYLTDIPSGSGAAVITILCTLFELRRSNILPRQPLLIKIIAGEISPTARGYFSEQLENMKFFLKEQAIDLEYEVLNWDVLCKVSTADFIKKMTISSQGINIKLLIFSNFSGFLQNSGKWNQAKDQFENIFLHSREDLSTVIWIEPQRNEVNSFFERIISWFKKIFSVIIPSVTTNEKSYAQSHANCRHSIRNIDFSVRITVVRFDLPKGVLN
ncbi:MAG: hypothetical protein RLZZ215_2999 [Pseudomonadota bacterium]